MLELRNIKKDYVVGDAKVHALKVLTLHLDKMNLFQCLDLLAVVKLHY